MSTLRALRYRTKGMSTFLDEHTVLINHSIYWLVQYSAERNLVSLLN